MTKLHLFAVLPLSCACLFSSSKPSLSSVQEKCTPLLKKVTSAAADTWERNELSNPRDKPKEYLYLVHAIKSVGMIPSTPEIGKERKGIFASLISSQKSETFGSGMGFILSVSQQHIIGTSPRDTVSVVPKKLDASDEAGWARLSARYQSQNGPILGPRALMEKTSVPQEDRINNEVLLRGNISNSPVMISGIFIKKAYKEKQDEETRSIVDGLTKFAIQHKLPIVYLDEISKN